MNKLVNNSAWRICVMQNISYKTEKGIKYLILPVVAAPTGVMNGIFYSADEWSKSLTEWEGVPVTLNHPSLDGEPFSAKSKKVKDYIIGKLLNVTFDGMLKGDIWFELKILQEKAANVLDKLINGQMIEVSTGLLGILTGSAGTYKGESFKDTITSIIPDHLAVLPEAVGACSLIDGCGVPRINENLNGGLNMPTEDVTTQEPVVVNINNDGSWVENLFTRIMNTIQPETEEPTQDPSVSDPVEPTPTVDPTDDEGEDDLSDLQNMVEQFGGVEAMTSMLNAAQTIVNEKRDKLLASLIANERLGFSEDDLKAMTTENLEKLFNALQAPVVANYSGLGELQTVTNTDTLEVLSMPVINTEV